MPRFVFTTSVCALLLAATAGAQQPAPAETRPAKPGPPVETAAPAPPRPPMGQPVNVKLDLTITDQSGTGEPSKKQISLIVADRQSGSIRSRGRLWPTDRDAVDVTINVDARPEILREGPVRVELALEYQPTPAVTGAPVKPNQAATMMNQRIGVVLEHNKPLIISQAFDPASDRKVSVELRATILK